VILTALLLSVQYGKTNDFTDSLCHLNQKTDCNHILTSPAAKITSWLGWSEVGFFYFMGGWIFNLTPAPLLSGEGFLNSPSLTGEGAGGWGLIALSFLALPYTFWSIWYQWRVAKQWCPLCVAVQVVIWMEVAVGSLEIMAVNPVSLLPTMDYRLWASFLSPILLWLIIKPLLLKSKQADGWQRELGKFKNNPALFEALLHQQKQMPRVPAELQPLILGNPAGEHTVTMVTNPYCGPCAKAHTELEKVLAENTQVKAQIVFAVCHDSDGRKTKVAKHMMALGSTYEKPEDGIAAWYDQTKKEYDTWAKSYPADTGNIPENVIAAHCEWTQKAEIQATPTFYVNGYEVPKVFGLKQSTNLLVHTIHQVEADEL
jgi:protein-disulfide isomerase/uncharacterized membrane protein